MQQRPDSRPPSIFALLALILIASGALILAVPKADKSAPETSASRSLAPQAETVVESTPLDKARELAENINAPLSIIFGLLGLYYSRRSYELSKLQAEMEAARHAQNH